MDSGIIDESKDDDDDSLVIDDEATDTEAIDNASENVSYRLEYEKQNATEQLSTVFGLLNIDPIHDK